MLNYCIINSKSHHTYKGWLLKECGVGISSELTEITCLLSIERAFLPSSNTKPKVNKQKNISITVKPYAALT